jgi:hypothetical protein
VTSETTRATTPREGAIVADELKIDIAVAEDRSAATLRFRSQGGVEASVALTPERLTALIAALGQVRARMVGSISPPPMGGMEVATVLQPRWHVQPDPRRDGSLLAFLHPGFGPLAFSLPREDVQRLVEVLTKHLEVSGAARPEKPH